MTMIVGMTTTVSKMSNTTKSNRSGNKKSSYSASSNMPRNPLIASDSSRQTRPNSLRPL